MSATIKHNFVSTKSDGEDTSLVRPSNWNETHIISGYETGQILFGNMSQDSGLFWDNTNKRLGIGVISPAESLDVAGNIKLTGHIVGGDGTCNPTNLLVNGDFELWTAGTSVAPDGWVLAGVGASIAREGTTKLIKSYSAKLISTSGGIGLSQDITALKGMTYWIGKKVTLSCWVSCMGSVRLAITDQATYSHYSPYNSGSSWQLLTVTGIVSEGTGVLYYNIQLDSGDSIAYVDGAIAVEGDSIFSFSDKPLILGNNVSTIPVSFGGNVGIGDLSPGELLDVAGNVDLTGVLKIDDVQVVSNRVIDSNIGNTIESAFTTLYPDASALLGALRTLITTHGLGAAS